MTTKQQSSNNKQQEQSDFQPVVKEVAVVTATPEQQYC